MMSVRDKPGNESWALPDHGDEQLHRRKYLPELVLPHRKRTRSHRTADRSDQPGSLTLQPVISVSNLDKTYASGFRALKEVNLEIRRVEIFALLGPNGAGKTTLINIICGIVNPGKGVVLADGHDIIKDYRAPGP